MGSKPGVDPETWNCDPCLVCGCGSEVSRPSSIAAAVRTLVKLTSYPQSLGLTSVKLESDGLRHGTEEFNLCEQCRANLEDIGSVLAQLEELNFKVTQFQKRISTQIQSTVDESVGIKHGGTQTGALERLSGTRRRILHELESRTRVTETGPFNPIDCLEIHSHQEQSSRNEDQSPQQTTSTSSRVMPRSYQPVVRLQRLEDQFPGSDHNQSPRLHTTSTTAIKQEPELEPEYLSYQDPDFSLDSFEGSAHRSHEDDGQAKSERANGSVVFDTGPDLDETEHEEFHLPKRRPGRPRKGDRQRYASKKVTPASLERERRVRCQYPECDFKCLRPTQIPPHVEASHFGDDICRHCGAFFPGQPEDFKTHEQAHIDEEKARLSCPYCPRTYPEFAKLRLHWKAKHPRKPAPTNPNPTSQRPPGWRKGVQYKEQTCPHYQKVFLPNPNSTIFKNHIASHTRPYKCEVDGCTATYSSTQSLRAHCIQSHPELGIPAFRCPHVDAETGIACSFTSAYTSSIDAHVKGKHATEKKYACTMPGCTARFINSMCLRQHVERIHERKKNYLCTECGIGFYFKDRLRVHMRTHTGERPFVCTTCGKGFIMRKDLRNHELVHRPERPHVCDYCGMAYPTKQILKGHLQSWHKIGGKGVYKNKKRKDGDGGDGGVQRVGVKPKFKGKYGEDGRARDKLT